MSSDVRITHPRRHPSAVVTLFVTDIESSTDLAGRLGDEEWVDLLEGYNLLVRAALARHRGREVKTTGDGFLAVFEHPASALRAAVALQRALADGAAGPALGPARHRIAVHTGRVVPLAGDVVGRNVHLVHRLAARARGGQILASSSAKALAGAAPEVGFGRAMAVELRGLAERAVVHPVAW